MSKYAHELEVGDPIEPRFFSISPEVNQQCLFAQEDFHPRYLPRADGEAEIVHPAIALQMLANTKSPSYKVPEHIAAILTETYMQFFEPLRVGKNYVSRWQVARTYTKRDKPYHEIRGEISDEAGRPVARRILQLAYIPKAD